MTHTRRLIFLSSLLLSSAAMAVDASPAGRRLAATCANCHGTDGVSAGGGMGSLAGYDKAAMLKAMRDFRTGARPATVMHQLAKGYSEDELALIATFFAAQPKPKK